MTTFIQIHLLTNYGPSNLNRDDLGRPKTAFVGGTERLRISSQCLKRTWRTSEFCQQSLAENMGIRTKEMGVRVFEALIRGCTVEEALAGKTEGKGKKLAPKAAEKISQAIAGVFGKPKKPKADKSTEHLEIEQLAFFSPAEVAAISRLTESCRESGKDPSEEERDLLRKENSAVDIAMFGRMLADKPRFNVEAAVQVSHAFTVHKVAVQDDFFTAVDDLSSREEDLGAGHMGIVEFGAGLFYTYLCVNKDLLVRNLDNNQDLAARALKALCESATQVAPTGKQSTFASRAWASYGLAEKGTEQPRSLAVAFLKPLEGPDLLQNAIKSLETCRENMNKVYGQSPASVSFNTLEGTGSLAEFTKFIAE